MKPRRMLLIVNPISGVNAKGRLSTQVAHALSALGNEVDVVFTERAGHASLLAAQAAADGIDSVIVMGGDGTLNEAASALCGTDVKIGIIPSGSGNGLARHLNIPVDELKSVDVIAQDYLVQCDCGEVNGAKFFCTCGLGFDAAVAHKFAKEQHRGKLTYIKNVIQELSEYKPQRCRLTLDGQVVETEALIVACCNASQYGNNAFISPHSSVMDGLLDVVVIKSVNALRTFVAGFDIMMGMVPHNHDILIYQTRQCSIDMEAPACAHIDGEPTMFDAHVDIRCLPAQVKLYASPDKPSFTPFVTPMGLTLRDWGLAIERLFR